MPPISSKIYGTTTMNEKGQVVIPAEARNELNLEPGARFTIIRAPFNDAVIIVKTEVLEKQIQTWSMSLSQPDQDTK